MHRETRRILAGGDIDTVLREGDLIQQASNFFSGMKNFSFGSGTLSKLAGGSSGGATTTTPVTGSATAPNAAYGGKSIADLAKDSAAQSLGKNKPAGNPNNNSIAPPATTPPPKTESGISMPKMGIFAKAATMTKSLKSSTSLGDKSASLKSLTRTANEMIESVAAGADPYRLIG